MRRVLRIELGQLNAVDVVRHLLHEARASFVGRRVAREVALRRETMAVRAVPAQRDAVVLVHLVDELRRREALQHLHVLEHPLRRLVFASGDLSA